MRSRVMICSERINHLIFVPFSVYMYNHIHPSCKVTSSHFSQYALLATTSSPSPDHISRPIIVSKLILPESSEMLLLARLRNLLDLFRRELERGHSQHVAQALLFGTGGYGHNVLVDCPTK